MQREREKTPSGNQSHGWNIHQQFDYLPSYKPPWGFPAMFNENCEAPTPQFHGTPIWIWY